jgi:murein DD-endopeptidase MepM/ murein hydrolase activator NlpD
LPTSTATATTTPTATATKPPAILGGYLFLDANGSGLRDNASFVCPDAIATPPSLGYFFSSAKCNPGQLVTVMEPGLAGFVLNATVNGQPITATTDANGNYRMVIPGGTDGQTVKMNIADPNAKDVALATRYINQWNKQVTVPAYEMNGVKVPEQRLNDTTTFPIAQGFSAKVGGSNQTGLMQGWVTLPILLADGNSYWISDWVDLNPNVGEVVNFYGNTDKYSGRNGRWPTGTEDSHYGLDIDGPMNLFVVAPADGNVFYIRSDNGNIQIMHGGQLSTGYGHLSNVVTGKTIVRRGQIVALNGMNGTNHPHIHFGITNEKTLDAVDFFDSPFLKDSCAAFPPGNGIPNHTTCNYGNQWTVYNLMVFPANK